MFRSEALELGRFKRTPDRWQTEFGRCVADFAVPRCAMARAAASRSHWRTPRAVEEHGMAVGISLTGCRVRDYTCDISVLRFLPPIPHLITLTGTGIGPRTRLGSS